ncbi:hypothetical protein SAMN04490243_2607 [Robiginitalea myxolifaciens]|uniref:Uncharacterized protein n=1 Tax=Robiginitalea myxolifaciens TaxID=400055 RepID=A0A1I6HE11_9FLAO|nr:hypothetical protein SAMN04490243_2607 [Robiginitalea myxolifaciens]
MYIALLLCLLLSPLQSCKEAEVYQKSGTVDPKNAGHYVEGVDGERNRLTSIRYLLTPDGKAEQHTLERDSRWSDYQLEAIRRGRWYNGDSTLTVILENEMTPEKNRDSVLQSYTQRLRPSERDSTLIDTLWAAQEESGKFLRLISRF